MISHNACMQVNNREREQRERKERNKSGLYDSIQLHYFCIISKVLSSELKDCGEKREGQSGEYECNEQVIEKCNIVYIQDKVL